MAKQDDFIKTALRIPRALHAQIQAAAEASGRSMNAEMIDRLQAHPDDGALAAVLERARLNEGQLLDATRKQRDLLWSIVDKTESVLAEVDMAMEQTKESAVRSNIGVLMDLIKTIKTYR